MACSILPRRRERKRLRRRLTAKFGQERVKDEGMIFFYIMSRCFMLRRWRRPATLVKRGQYPS